MAFFILCYNKFMNNQSILEIVIKARDEASAQLKGLQGSLQNMEGAFTTMRNVGVGAFAAISAVVYKTTSDYADAEKSAKMLEHAVIDVSHATKEQLAATSALADELERKGVLDGDNIKMGLAQLSTFGLSNDAVRGLGSSLADLAVNQFGVKASGEQLSDTANMIAKALNGQFGVLEKSGIRFTDAQKSIIKFGSEMEKVKAINEGFAQNLKYTNEVALTTLEGQLAKTQVQVGNISESIGQALTPVLEKMLSALVPIIQKLLDWATTHQDLLAKILMVSAGIAGMVAVIGSIGLILPVIIGLINPFTIILVALAGAFGYVASQAGGTDSIMSSLKLTFDNVKSAVMEVVAYIENMWATFQRSEVATFLNMVLQQLWSTLKDLWAQFKELWTIIEPVILPLLKLLATIIGGVVIAAITGLVVTLTMLAKGLSWLIELLKPLIEMISKTLVAAFNIANSAIQTFMGWIDSVIGKINDLIALASRAASAVGGLFSSAGSSVSSLFSGKKADGGSVYGGNSYLVGENGPEMFTPNSTGTIIPNGGIGGGVINLNITGNSFLGDDDVADKIGSAIMKSLQFQLKF
jgi:hypothetical protein